MRWVSCFAVFVAVEFCGLAPAPAQHRSTLLIVYAGITDAKVAAELLRDAVSSGHRAVELRAETVKLADQLRAEIDAGRIAEDGPDAPAQLDAFSKAVLAAIPDLFDHRRIRVISEEVLPLELVRHNTIFLGDIAEVAHEYPNRVTSSLVGQRNSKLPMLRYVIEATIGMPTGMSRIDQDIVKMALALEREIPVELHFGGDSDTLRRQLSREDVSILHIDTHGGPGGRSIQASRAGTMLDANEIAAPIRAPLVLLFGCEGLNSSKSFGSVLYARGAQAVVSSFAEFNSFGLTGDPVREQQIYEAFFSSIKAGHTIGAALVSLRQAALREGRASSQGTTLTRLFFVLLGRDDIVFAWPKASGQ